MSTNVHCHSEAVLMSTHNICCLGEIKFRSLILTCGIRPVGL